LLVIFGAAKRP